MTSVYVKLIIEGSRTIKTIKAQHVTEVAVILIKQGASEGKVYVDFNDIPEKFKQDVKDELAAEGFDTEGNPIE